MSPEKPSPEKLLITLCTYNERENIERLIPAIQQVSPTADILVIDDNSPDGTGQWVDEMAGNDSRIRALHRQKKEGLGGATLAGFRYGIEHGYELLLNLDADFSHHPRYIPLLLEGIQKADVVIGSRYVLGGGIEGWGMIRHLMSRGINGYARFLLRLKTADNSGSFRCYRVAELQRLDFNRIRARGYAFQEEILYRCRRIACRFAEVPIVFEDRRYGHSKINWREVLAALGTIFRLGIDNIFNVSVERDNTAE